MWSGAREVMEEETGRVDIDLAQWPPLMRAALPAEEVAFLTQALAGARRPLIVTSYLGREARGRTVTTRAAAMPPPRQSACSRSVPNFMNYPHDDELYQGNQWNELVQNKALAEADVVLVVDSDVPWIPTVSRPGADAAIYHIDIDPLKQAMPLWYIKARRSYAVDAMTALRQLNAHLDGLSFDRTAASRRARHYAGEHAARAAEPGGVSRGAAERRHHHSRIRSRLACAGRRMRAHDPLE